MSFRWTPPYCEGSRHVLLAGRVEIGAVFPPLGQGDRFWRWRVWISGSLPIDGVSRSEADAKAVCEAHLHGFMAKAGMVFAPAPGAAR